MYQKFRETFKQFDLFGRDIQLNFNGEDSYRTGAGGFLTLIIIAVLIMFFQSNIILFFQKQNITTSLETNFSDDPDTMVLADGQYMWAVNFAQNAADSFPIKPQFNITAYQVTQTKQSDGTYKLEQEPINLIQCELKRFNDIFMSYGLNRTDRLNLVGITNYLCPDYNFKIKLQGQEQSQVYQYLKFDVTPCNNNTSPNQFLTWRPVCQSTAMLNSYFTANNAFQVQFFTTNWQVNAQNPDNYIQAFLDEDLFFTFVPQRLKRDVNIYLKKYSIFTDESLAPVFTDIKNDTLFIRDPNDFKDIVNIGSNLSTIYTTLYFLRSPFTNEIIREYQKFDNLLSYLGGFVNIIVVSIGFLAACYNRQQYLIELSNKIYNFEDDGDENKYKSSTKEEVSKASENKTDNFRGLQTPQAEQSQENFLKSPQDSPKIFKVLKKQETLTKKIQFSKQNSSFQEDQSLNKSAILLEPKQRSRSKSDRKMEFDQYPTGNSFKKEQEELVKRVGFKSRQQYLQTQIYRILSQSKPIMFNIKFLINQATCGKLFRDKKVQLLEKAVAKINQDLDIYVILEKVQQTNLLKELLLTKEQQILFNFAPKPMVKLDKEKTIPSRVQLEKDTLNQSMSLGNSKNKFDLHTIASAALQRKQQVLPQSFENELNAYNKLYKVFFQQYINKKAYDKIQNSDNGDSNINQILINKLGREIKDIFEVSFFIDFNSDKKKIPKRIEQALKRKLAKIRNQHFSDDSDENVNDDISEQVDQDILKRSIGLRHP